ncbi:hypothetical protein C0992_003055, partial [Termitomyces sp. T32_za158]
MPTQYPDDSGYPGIEIGRTYGPWFRFYLRAHGYLPSFTITLHTLFQTCKTSGDFVENLSSLKGMNITEGEAKFIFHL